MSWSKKVQQLAIENNGELPSIIFPCVVIYVDRDYSEICWKCANKEKEESVFNVVDYYMENDTEYLTDILCAECQKSFDPALREKKEERGKVHYIAMFGLYGGYLPSMCEVFQSEENAIQFLAEFVYNAEDGKIEKELLIANRELVRQGYNKLTELEFITEKITNNAYIDLVYEYGEIIECVCDNPQIHSENELKWEEE